MHLINTKTLVLEEFEDGGIPPYAILSHTWGSDSEELTFSDVKNGITNKPGIGSIKFRKCCEQAQEDSLGYAWIDTCCIDKTNLVELGEAINSMFRWYSLAKVCYAYLSDVLDDEDPSDYESKFRISRWFKRGWTLQELLAPQDLRFYNSEWRCIGNKGTKSIVIRDITRVPRQFLLNITELHTASIAQRMSWAAQRETKRAEDLAYCLLGIFGIAMPMIYGEGGKAAFFRLQEQIMKTTRDDSILAWGLSNEFSMSDPPQSIDGDFIHGDILAASPSDFANSWQITTREQATNPLHSLDIYGGSLRIYSHLLPTGTSEALGLLSCGPKHDKQQVVAIPLAKISSAVANEYVRPRGSSSVLQPIPASGVSPELIHIKKDGQWNISTKVQNYLFCEEHLFAEIGLNIYEVEPKACWDKERALISQTTNNIVADQILVRVGQSKEPDLDFVIVINFQEPDSPIELLCYIFPCHRGMALEGMAGRFQRKTLEAFRQTTAGIRSLYLNIKLEPVERNIASITPEVVNCLPDYTISAAMALGNSELVLEPIRLLWEKSQNDAKMKSLSAHIAEKFHLKYIYLERWKRNKGFQLNSIGEERERRKEEFYLKYIRGERDRIKFKFDREYEKLQIRRKITKGLSREMEEFKEDLEECSWEDLEECFWEDPQEHFKYYYEEKTKRRDQILEQLVLDESVFNEKRFTAVEEMEHFEKDHAKIRKRQDKILEQLVQAQKRLKDLYRTEGCQDGWTPFRSAMVKGDIGLMDLLFDESTDIMAEDERWFPWIAASRKGEAEQIRLLLETDRSGLDCKDGIFGRTPLSWASMNGHRDVVKLLLDTKQVDLRSKDNRGRTPPRWALEKGHHDIVRLLLDHWDKPATIRLDCGHDHDIISVALSHDSKLLASGSGDRAIKLWDSETGKCIHTLQGHRDYITLVALSHDSKLLASGSGDRTIKLWDSETGKCIHTLQGHQHYITSVAFSHDAKLLASGSGDRTTKLWDSETGRCLHTLQGHRYSITSVAFSHDSKLIASGSSDETIKLWDSETGRCLHIIPSHGKVDLLLFLHNSKILATQSLEGSINLWDSKTGENIQTLEGNDDFVYLIALSHDLKLLASAGSDGRVRLWDNRTGECIHTFHTSDLPHEFRTFFKLSRFAAHDFKTLVLPSTNSTAELWNVSIVHDLINSTRYPDSLLLD